MPRDLPLANGNLYVAFDREHRIREILFPYVGMENHATGHPFRIGVWIDGRFSWLGSDGWSLEAKYLRDTLVTDVKARREDIGLELVFREAVDFHLNVFVRRVEARNLRGGSRELRLFYAQDFHVYGNDVGDTAYYDPNTQGMVHYKGKRWFLVNLTPGGVRQFATGKKSVQGAEGTWKDCEDGHLQGNPIAQGSVDSAIGLTMELPPNGTAVSYFTLAAGESYSEVEKIHRVVDGKSPEEVLRRTENYWRLWTRTPSLDREGLTDAMVDLYYRSLLIVRAQTDHDGGVLAANDSDILHFSKDTYSYIWPRDGALVIAALSDSGYTHLARKFFEFCARVIDDEGYFLHKYNCDGSLASSWHPWWKDGVKELPIQEDETALVLWALRRYFQRSHQLESVKPLYRSLIVAAADFLAAYRDERTGLPLPSHDLWEERRAVHTFTVSAVIGALRAAAAFAADFGEEALATKYGGAAAEVSAAFCKHLWDPDANRFARSATVNGDGTVVRDLTIDAANYAVFYLRALPVHDPRVEATLRSIRERLYVKTPIGGVARYENDYYHQVSKDVENVAGNPWFICTLWLAQYEIERAKTIPELEERARPLMQWVVDHALPSGVLAEQVNPYTGEPMSVSPLTWSHATFVSAVNEYVAKFAALKAKK